MTILDGMLPPPKLRNKDLERLIEVTRQRVGMLDIEDLARAAAHEYDEEVAAPAPGSPGERFLRATATEFSRWLGREGRFPADDEVDEIATEVVWHRETVGSVVAQAFVDLGLFYSRHADAARGATIADFQRVLDSVASQLIFTLTEEHAPLV